VFIASYVKNEFSRVSNEYSIGSSCVLAYCVSLRSELRVICVCLRIVVSGTCCFVFLRLVHPMLSVSLDCPFLIVPSVFSSVYFVKA
jgi:hypothetical protein